MADSFKRDLAPGEQRYVVKKHVAGRSTRYEVYDRATGSYPAIRAGIFILTSDTEAEAQAQIDILNQIDP